MCLVKKKTNKSMNILHYFLFTSLTKSNFRISSFMKVLYTFYLPAFEINLIAIRLDKKKSTNQGVTGCTVNKNRQPKFKWARTQT